MCALKKKKSTTLNSNLGPFDSNKQSPNNGVNREKRITIVQFEKTLHRALWCNLYAQTFYVTCFTQLHLKAEKSATKIALR